MSVIKFKSEDDIIFVVKEEFFNNILLKDAKLTTSFYLLQKYKIYKYLHCEDGPAMICEDENLKNYFLNGEPIFGEALNKIKEKEKNENT